MRLRRFLPSPAMLVAVTALVLSLGGSAYALVVTGKTIRNNSVTNADIRQRTLTGNDMGQDKVGGGADQGVDARNGDQRASSPAAAPASPSWAARAPSGAAAASARWPAPESAATR